MSRELMAVVADKVESRYFGKYRAFVVENDDPEKRGRLRLRIPGVLGRDVVSGWALPCVPFGGANNQGHLFIPEQGAGVWVEFEAGDLDHPVWVGTFWSKPGGRSEIPRANKADGTEADAPDPATRKIIKTAKGHTIQFEDRDGEEMVVIVEATHGHVVALDRDGVRITEGRSGSFIEMTESAFNVVSRKPFKIDASGQSVTIVGATIDFNKG